MTCYVNGRTVMSRLNYYYYLSYCVWIRVYDIVFDLVLNLRVRYMYGTNLILRAGIDTAPYDLLRQWTYCDVETEYDISDLTILAHETFYVSAVAYSIVLLEHPNAVVGYPAFVLVDGM